MSPDAAHQEAALAAVDFTARSAYGRLLAYLAKHWRDLAAAEDALAEAFAAALRDWPTDGVPRHPEGWLLTAARRRLMDGARHEAVRAAAETDIAATLERLLESNSATMTVPDERLALMFVCAHPAIAPEVRTPLMLQTVLGLDSERIASAFLVAPTAMAQRLVRAKAKIRDAGILFSHPESAELPARLDAVLEGIYAAYGSGWSETSETGANSRGLAREALWLGRVLARLMPSEPEALGLLALMLHCEARRGARHDAGGGFVPLDKQDTALWSQEMMDEAESRLSEAAREGRIGRFQLEAAIQSAHARRARDGKVEWDVIVRLYDGLLTIAPTLGAMVGRAAARAEADGTLAGLADLNTLPKDRCAVYQPAWALRAHLLQRLGRLTEARVARDQAIGLCEDAAVRAYLRKTVPD